MGTRTAKITLGISALFLGGMAIWFWKTSQKRSLDQFNHRAIRSEISLNAQQRKELLPPDPHALLVRRYKDTQGLWQVVLGEEIPQGAKDLFLLGTFYSTSVSTSVDLPIYLCSYEGFSGANSGLDTQRNCSGDGKLTREEPVGFTSKVFRTGFLMLVRCRNREHGMYLSLNPKCEDAEDRLVGDLGAIRAAGIE